MCALYSRCLRGVCVHSRLCVCVSIKALNCSPQDTLFKKRDFTNLMRANQEEHNLVPSLEVLPVYRKILVH